MYADKLYYKIAASTRTSGEIEAFVTKRAFGARSTIMHAKRVMSTLAKELAAIGGYQVPGARVVR